MSSSSIKKALLLLLLAFLVRPVNAFADEATVLWLDGDVQVQAPGSETPEPVAAGAVIPEGARVVTSDNATCGLGFNGPLAESAVTLKPSTSAQMKNLGDMAQIDLEKGALFVKLAKLKKDSQFTVNSPTATATARGTGWLQSTELVEVFEGTVSLKSSGGQEESPSEGQAYEISVDGASMTQKTASDEGRAAWETFGKRAMSSPYFNRISAVDILKIREAIDSKRKSSACGSREAYAWQMPVAAGNAISAAQINELKTALAEPPFAQNPDFVSKYLDPIPTLSSGDVPHASTLSLISDAAEKASC